MCTQITIALTLTDVDASVGVHRHFVRVNFVESAQRSEVLQPFSGNPGYQRGLPLLVRHPTHVCTLYEPSMCICCMS